jgi:pimeloyl-ACP methyl ester carboxylesterase
MRGTTPSRRLQAGLLTATAAMLATTVSGAPPASAATTAATATATQPADIVSAPTLVAHTRDGDVGYREVGRGSAIVLITGQGGTMDDWAPSFVDALAAHHTVVVFDNAGIGETSPLAAPLTIPAMADQTSALITTLRLYRPAVLGWSLGGVIAQDLAVRHPFQVGRLILAATQAGTGQSAPIPPAVAAELNSTDPAVLMSLLFGTDEAAAEAYLEGIVTYPNPYKASDAVKDEQTAAFTVWMAGGDPAGRHPGAIHAPTLVADGTQDVIDPTSNDYLLAHVIPFARLVLYPDAGHGFLFQDTAQFLAAVDRFVS